MLSNRSILSQIRESLLEFLIYNENNFINCLISGSILIEANSKDRN